MKSISSGTPYYMRVSSRSFIALLVFLPVQFLLISNCLVCPNKKKKIKIPYLSFILVYISCSALLSSILALFNSLNLIKSCS